MRRVMGDHLEGFGDEGPPHGGLYVLIDLLDPSAGFVLGYQLDAWQNSSRRSLGRALCSSLLANEFNNVV